MNTEDKIHFVAVRALPRQTIGNNDAKNNERKLKSDHINPKASLLSINSIRPNSKPNTLYKNT
ncbi:hypothetical protein D3C85_1468370 [compost metagenome]